MKIHNKLVRDKVLEVLSSKGIDFQYRVLELGELVPRLCEKLEEELDELSAELHQPVIDREKVLMEMGDCREVIKTIEMHAVNSKDLTRRAYHLLKQAMLSQQIIWVEVLDAQLNKKERLGGFNKRIYLEYTSE